MPISAAAAITREGVSMDRAKKIVTRSSWRDVFARKSETGHFWRSSARLLKSPPSQTPVLGQIRRLGC